MFQPGSAVVLLGGESSKPLDRAEQALRNHGFRTQRIAALDRCGEPRGGEPSGDAYVWVGAVPEGAHFDAPVLVVAEPTDPRTPLPAGAAELRLGGDWSALGPRLQRMLALEASAPGRAPPASVDANPREDTVILQGALRLAEGISAGATADACLSQFATGLARELSAAVDVWPGSPSAENPCSPAALVRAARGDRLVQHAGEGSDRSAVLVPLPREGLVAQLVVLHRAAPFRAGELSLIEHAQSFLRIALSAQASMARLRETEAQLRQSERVQSVGQLAGGVAHDFNNMLMVLTAAAEVMRDGLGPDHRHAPHVRLILETSHRAAELTRKLLGFSRKSRMSLEVLDVHELLATVRELLEHTLDRRIRIAMSSSEGMGRIRADATHLQSALLNLCLNARDAMPAGGELSIRLRRAELTEEEAREALPSGAAGPCVAIEIEDTGVGMDERTLKRVFDPFFTTKEPGAGTGLGLSVVLATVREHGGAVRLSSRPGVGTRCTVLLPRADGPGAARSVAPGSAALEARALKILLVDDEPGVCRATAHWLRQLGHNVRALRDGARALRHLLTHFGDYDLLVLDVVTPRPTGIEVYQQLAQAGARLPTVFVSGSHEPDAVVEAERRPDVVFLQKPFRQAELERAIARVGASGASGAGEGDTERERGVSSLGG